MNRVSRMLMIAAGVIAAGALSARAAQVSIEASEDASLLGGSDATGNASLSDPGFFVGTDGQDNPKRGLVLFNVAGAVPAGATITAVSLQMTVGQIAGSGGGGGAGSGGDVTISLFDETQAWGQTTNVPGATSFGGHGHGAAPNAGDATWNFAFYNSTPADATAWAIPGGNWSTTSTDIADASVPATLTSNTWSSAAMVSDVQNWLNNPSDNFGWLVKNSDETDATDFRAFYSTSGAANNGNSALAPTLTITFTPVPEPAGMAVGLAAGLLLRRRRRA